MTRRFALVLAVWALGSALMAGEGKAPATPVRNDEQQLAATEEEWVRAEGNHDTATLERILDPQFVHTSGTGKLLDRAAFIADVTEGPVDPTLTQTLTDRTIVINGDTAIVVETDTIRWTKNGQPVESVHRLTVTYIRRNGHWRALAEHMVKVSPK